MTFSLTIEASDLLAAIKLTSQVSDNGNIQILKSTLISVNGNAANFTATNSNQTITARYPATGSGSICVETSALLAKIQTLKPGAQISLEIDGPHVVAKSGRSKWKLPYLPANDFPSSVSDPVDADPVSVGPDFLAAINSAIGAAEINLGASHAGVRIDGNSVVATNGKQLRVIEFDGTLPSFTLPPSVAKLIPAECDIRASEHAVSFSTDTMTIKTKLIENSYPDWQRILSSFDKNLTGSASVDRDEFIAALEMASAIKVSGEKAGSFVNMRITINQDEVDVFTRNHVENEEGSAVCQCERDGPDSQIGVNGRMLIDAVKSLACDTVRILYGDTSTPMILSPLNSPARNIRMVMPRMFT